MRGDKHIWRENMNKVVKGAVGLGLLCMSAVPAVAATDISKLPVVTQELVAPPFVPKHDQVAKGGPKVVKVRMETIEKLV
jgi:nitrite reductase (NO-forming)